MKSARDWARERARADWETEAGAEAFIREIQEDSRCFATGGFTDPKPLDPGTVFVAHHYETPWPREIAVELTPKNVPVNAFANHPDFAEPHRHDARNSLVAYVPKHVFESFREYAKRNGAVAQIALARLSDVTKALVVYLDTPTHLQTSRDLMALWEMAQNIRRAYWPEEFLK